MSIALSHSQCYCSRLTIGRNRALPQTNRNAIVAGSLLLDMGRFPSRIEVLFKQAHCRCHSSRLTGVPFK